SRAGRVRPIRGMAGRAHDVLPVRDVRMAGGACQRDRRRRYVEGSPERMRIGAGDREPLAVIERGRVAARVAAQASLAVGRDRWIRKALIGVADAPDGHRTETGM